MAWQDPVTGWTDLRAFNIEDANRIEGNIDFLGGNGTPQQLGTDDDVQHANMTVDSLTSGGAVSGTTGTFSGAISGTTGAFTTVNTGHGANELYPMDQAVRTTDDVRFRQITITEWSVHGSNVIYSSIFSALSGAVPSIGNAVKVSGGLNRAGNTFAASKLERISSTVIRFYGVSPTATTIDIASTDGASNIDISIVTGDRI